jgi:hypothetical protein
MFFAVLGLLGDKGISALSTTQMFDVRKPFNRDETSASLFLVISDSSKFFEFRISFVRLLYWMALLLSWNAAPLCLPNSAAKACSLERAAWKSV